MRRLYEFRARNNPTTRPLDRPPGFAFHAGMARSRFASIEFVLSWQGNVARQPERVNFEKPNFWRDSLSGSLAHRLGALDVNGVAAGDPLYAVWGTV